MTKEQKEQEKLNHAYTGSNIEVLEGLEPVRKRPGMYIGSTGVQGLHHLVWEIVDNSIDEALAGYCDHIEVEIFPDNIVRVSDNGRGIPVDKIEKTGKSALETVFTVLHAGGKFDGGGYEYSGGLHGVGASVVNALSVKTQVIVQRDGFKYRQEFSRGKPEGTLEQIGATEETGTMVTFQPDPEIFQETTEFDFEKLSFRLQESAFLNKDLRITLSDYRDPENEKSVSYIYEGGIKEYVQHLNKNKKPIHPQIIYIRNKIEGVEIEIAMQYTETFNESFRSFANNVTTPDGGTHVEGFRSSLTRIINSYGKDIKVIRKDVSLSGEDVREGLTCIISVRHPNPEYEGQTKTKLGNPEVRKIISQIFSEGMEQFLNENPTDARNIIDKIYTTYEARLAAQKAREATRRKNPLDVIDFASKLSDCRSEDPSKCEIYIVEGDSAGGSARQGRDSEFQAILPLRGKVLNVEKSRQARALNNNEIVSMIKAFGTGIMDDCDIEQLRYHKVIIMTDADVDGAHIRTLLLTFFFRYMPALIFGGHVYIAQPPLYKVSYGKRVYYAYDDKELKAILDRNAKSNNPQIQRYKGLGEMNPEQLWETTMDPERRTLLKVTVSDDLEADAVFTRLMGDDVEPRREFIEENAKFAVHLDI